MVNELEVIWKDETPNKYVLSTPITEIDDNSQVFSDKEFKIINNIMNFLRGFYDPNDSYDFELTIKFDNDFTYYTIVENNEYCVEEIFYKTNLIFKIDKDEKIPDLSPDWFSISNTTPDFIIRFNRTSIVFEYRNNIFDKVRYAICSFKFLPNFSITKEDRRKVIEQSTNLLLDEEIRYKFREIIPKLFSDIFEITDDLKIITNKDPNGDLIKLEDRGSGINRIFALLPLMLGSLKYDHVLLIPNLNLHFHFLVSTTLRKLYQSESIKESKGRILTYKD